MKYYILLNCGCAQLDIIRAKNINELNRKKAYYRFNTWEAAKAAQQFLLNHPVLENARIVNAKAAQY